MYGSTITKIWVNVMVFNATFNNFSYIVAVSFIGGNTITLTHIFVIVEPYTVEKVRAMVFNIIFQLYRDGQCHW